MILCKFQVYILIQRLFILQSDHQQKSIYHPLPYNRSPSPFSALLIFDNLSNVIFYTGE